MNEDLVNIYEADSMMTAQLVVDRLAAADIEAFIDNSDSPFDGLTAGDQMKVVRVLPDHAARAAEIVQTFLAEAGRHAGDGDAEGAGEA